MEMFMTYISHTDSEGAGLFAAFWTESRPTSDDIDALNAKMLGEYADVGYGVDFSRMGFDIRIHDSENDPEEGGEIEPQGEGRRVFWTDEEFHSSGPA